MKKIYVERSEWYEQIKESERTTMDCQKAGSKSTWKSKAVKGVSAGFRKGLKNK